MGSYFCCETEKTKSLIKIGIPDKLFKFVPYIAAVSDMGLIVDLEVDIVVKESKLKSEFVKERNMGVFTNKKILNGTIILPLTYNIESKINDGVANLNEILRASNSVEMYNAWDNFYNSYYDIEKVKKNINVRLILDKYNNNYYQAIMDIPANGELLRFYGFTTWPFELLHIFTNKTIVGFISFINHFASIVKSDPNGVNIKLLQSACIRYTSTNNIISIIPSIYDFLIQSHSTFLVGPTILSYYQSLIH